MLVALSGLRSRPARQAELADHLAAGDLTAMAADALAAGGRANALAARGRADGELVGCPALQQAADVASGGTAA